MDRPRWNLVYLAVLAFTVVVIVLLQAFSEAFTPSWLQ